MYKYGDIVKLHDGEEYFLLFDEEDGETIGLSHQNKEKIIDTDDINERMTDGEFAVLVPGIKIIMGFNGCKIMMPPEHSMLGTTEFGETVVVTKIEKQMVLNEDVFYLRRCNYKRFNTETVPLDYTRPKHKTEILVDEYGATCMAGYTSIKDIIKIFEAFPDVLYIRGQTPVSRVRCIYFRHGDNITVLEDDGHKKVIIKDGAKTDIYFKTAAQEIKYLAETKPVLDELRQVRVAYREILKQICGYERRINSGEVLYPEEYETLAELKEEKKEVSERYSYLRSYFTDKNDRRL